MRRTSAGGDIDRHLTEQEKRAAGKAVAEIMKRLGHYPQEVTTYTLTTLIDAMTSTCADPEAAQRDVLGKISDLLKVKV